MFSCVNVDKIPDWLVQVKLIPTIGILKSGLLTVKVDASLRTLTYIRCGIDCSWTEAPVIWNLGVDEVMVDPSE
jgi:hypothetical protein